jgi:hypothetical membrane protein
MSNKTISWLKISGTCGIITPSVAFSCILLAIAYAPHFSWTDNALSDLGVMPNPTSVLFNLGLIVSGILAIVFAFGLLIFFNETVSGRIGGIMFVLDCLALICIGIFPESAKPMHLYASVAFFAIFPLAMFLMTASFVLSSKHRMAVFTFSIAVFAAVVWAAEFLMHYVPGVAIPETLSALAACLWVAVLSFNMLRKPLNPDT